MRQRNDTPRQLSDQQVKRELRKLLAAREHWLLVATGDDTRAAVGTLLADAERRPDSHLPWEAFSLPGAGVHILCVPKRAMPRARLVRFLRRGCPVAGLQPEEDCVVLASEPMGALRGLSMMGWLAEPQVGGDGASEPPFEGPTRG